MRPPCFGHLTRAAAVALLGGCVAPMSGPGPYGYSPSPPASLTSSAYDAGPGRSVVGFSGAYQRPAASSPTAVVTPMPSTGGGGTPIASSCPASLDGHRASGAQLYQGPPERNMLQMPGTPAGPNTYAVGDQFGTYFARCIYQGTARTQLIQLSPGLSLCRYANGVRFTCN